MTAIAETRTCDVHPGKSAQVRVGGGRGSVKPGDVMMCYWCYLDEVKYLNSPENIRRLAALDGSSAFNTYSRIIARR